LLVSGLGSTEARGCCVSSAFIACIHGATQAVKVVVEVVVAPHSVRSWSCQC
jgi:hypothetical protein